MLGIKGLVLFHIPWLVPGMSSSLECVALPSLDPSREPLSAVS